jgi:hypothetical protein
VKRVRHFRLVLLAVLAVAAAACHSGDDVSDSGGSSLTAALASVAGTDNTRLYFEWADLARIRDLAAVTKDKPIGTSDVDHRRWGTLFGTGTGSLAPVAPKLADTIDLFSARTAVLIGQPPQTAVRVDGVDAGTARAGLARLGGKQGQVAGHDGMILGSDHEVDQTGGQAKLGLVNTFNKTAFDGDRVAFGEAEPAVGEAVNPGDHPLSTDAGVAAAASCLGGVLTATIAPGEKSHLAGAQTVAIGVRDPAKGSDPAVEELCLVASDKTAADALESRVRQHATTSAMSQVTRQPWSALVTSITVTRAGDTAVRVELTNRPERAANLLRAALQNQDLLSLTG